MIGTSGISNDLVVTLLELVGTRVAGEANVTVGHDVGDGVSDDVGPGVGVAGLNVRVGCNEASGDSKGDLAGCGVEPHATATHDNANKTTRRFID